MTATPAPEHPKPTKPRSLVFSEADIEHFSTYELDEIRIASGLPHYCLDRGLGESNRALGHFGMSRFTE